MADSMLSPKSIARSSLAPSRHLTRARAQKYARLLLGFNEVGDRRRIRAMKVPQGATSVPAIVRCPSHSTSPKVLATGRSWSEAFRELEVAVNRGLIPVRKVVER
jgi:hypothetical protein